MGRKSNEQKELERQQALANNPKLRFEMDEKVSLKRFMKYYGYGSMTKQSIDKLYSAMKSGKMITHTELATIMSEGGYSCHTLTLNALYNGLTGWNSKRAKFIEPSKLEVKVEEITSPIEEVKEVKPVSETPVIINGGVTIAEEPKAEEVIITTNVQPEEPVVEVKIEEVTPEVKVEQPAVEAKPKRKRGRKSKAEKEAERLAAEQAKAQETSNDNN